MTFLACAKNILVHSFKLVCCWHLVVAYRRQLLQFAVSLKASSVCSLGSSSCCER